MQFYLLVHVVLLAGCLVLTEQKDQKYDNDKYHPAHPVPRRKNAFVNPDELENSFWDTKAQKTLKQHIENKLNTNVAKNVILFLGDGMSIPTVAAARIYQGELNGLSSQEGTLLSFQEFPYTGLSLTYCVDKQVADSACSSTAYLGGVKGNEGTIGVNAHVERGDCEAMLNVSNHVHSLAYWAQKQGKMTGTVTTTRVTHASPAGMFAHVADRDWESDADVAKDDLDTEECDDIARQLIKNEPGKNLNVIFGGGRSNFIPERDDDPVSGTGNRLDGVNLISAWMDDKKSRNASYEFMWTREQMMQLNGSETFVLGLFGKSHLDKRLENNTNQPSLAEMTETAINILQQSDKGYFLFVEGGLIDLAHHDNYVRMALDETVEFSNAIRRARELTDESETLIVVTSDHAHTMTQSGYANRGESVFGFAGKGQDDNSYTALNYANGPGYKTPVNNVRPPIDAADLDKVKYKFPAGVPLSSETHGGDDVGVYANGPWAHLFTGAFEENFIPHAIRYAACLGDGLTACI